MLSNMARRPPSHVQHANGLHHQPYRSPSSHDDDNEEERDARRTRSRLLANKISESLLNRSSSIGATTKEDSIEQRAKAAIDTDDVDGLRKLYCQPSLSLSVERRFKSGGWTALIHAAYSCHFSLVSLLVLELGADVNGKSSEQMSPLMACCMSSHSKSSSSNGNDEQLSICRLLLEQGAEVEPSSPTTDEKIMSPLMFAARFGCSPPLIRLLFEHGARVDRRDSKGWCPLIMATQHGHLGSVEALIRVGADPQSTTQNGLTALDIARHLRHEAIVNFLLLHQTQSTLPSISSPPSDNQSISIVDDVNTEETNQTSEQQQYFEDDPEDNLPPDLKSNEQSWPLMAYVGAATAIGSGLLLVLVYMRRG